MEYFGIAKCPYCGKRVNLIRSWSLKKEGEYKCPRCSGISNIFLSPLVYVFGILAIFVSASIYFFHKFILNDITFKTLLWVAMPFILFYIVSLFMPHLKRPVIKKAPIKDNQKMSKDPLLTQTGYLRQMQAGIEEEEYLPAFENQTGAVYMEQQVNNEENQQMLQKTAVMPSVGTSFSQQPQTNADLLYNVRSQERPISRPVRGTIPPSKQMQNAPSVQANTTAPETNGINRNVSTQGNRPATAAQRQETQFVSSPAPRQPVVSQPSAAMQRPAMRNNIAPSTQVTNTRRQPVMSQPSAAIQRPAVRNNAVSNAQVTNTPRQQVVSQSSAAIQRPAVRNNIAQSPELANTAGQAVQQKEPVISQEKKVEVVDIPSNFFSKNK